MVGAIGYRLEAVEGKGVKGGGNSRTRGSTCGGDGDTRIRSGSRFRTSPPHEGVEHRQHRGGGVTGGFYAAVTQQVLLFGAESWVLTKRM